MGIDSRFFFFKPNWESSLFSFFISFFSITLKTPAGLLLLLFQWLSLFLFHSQKKKMDKKKQLEIFTEEEEEMMIIR